MDKSGPWSHKCLILLSSFISCFAFQIDIDFNTYNTIQLTFATSRFRTNGTWTITNNSPDVSASLWSTAITSVGRNVFSEDNPGSTRDCTDVRTLAGSLGLLATFQYHETGGTPATMLTWDEITAASAACGGAGVIILTRAFWPGSDWRTKVEAVLSHPLLYGVAMEFNPSDYGKRDEPTFVQEVLAAGKFPFFLLPFVFYSVPTETSMLQFLQFLQKSGSPLHDTRIHFVLARYNPLHIPIAGTTNSIASALAVAQAFQQRIEAHGAQPRDDGKGDSSF